LAACQDKTPTFLLKNTVRTACKIEAGGVYGGFAADFSERKIATLQIL